MGDMSAGAEAIDDFILVKSDGYPTYNFAHIIDDVEMHISHVIRGQEFLASTPNYLNLYEALDIPKPVLATMPHILGPTGTKKLSKRDGAKDVLDYIRDGFLPEAMINFIASLGWNDGTEQEVFTTDELIQKFSLERVGRSGAHFDAHLSGSSVHLRNVDDFQHLGPAVGMEADGAHYSASSAWSSMATPRSSRSADLLECEEAVDMVSL